VKAQLLLKKYDMFCFFVANRFCARDVFIDLRISNAIYLALRMEDAKYATIWFPGSVRSAA